MSDPAQDIPITYINGTGAVNFQVVVYETGSKVAWRVLVAQTKAEFVYPASTGVGAYYAEDNVKFTMGPFPAQPGSTWEIKQDSAFNAAVLKVSAESSPDGYFVVKNAAKSPCDGVYNIGLYKDDALLVVQPDVQPVSAESNPDGNFVVKNAATSPCNGVYNIGLYKDDALLVVQPDVRIGTTVQYQLQNSLSFGVVQEVSAGNIFNPDNVKSPTKFDLDKFPCGLVVNLSQDPDSGEYVFTGTSDE